MGIHREDKFNKYAFWGALDRILEDADEHIQESSFEKEPIMEVLNMVFVE